MLGYHDVRPSGCVDVAEQLLQHEAADARAGVDRRQDEHRLEHDREVIPERRGPAPLNTLPRMPAMPTARLGAPPVRESSVASPICCGERVELLGLTREAPLRDRLRGRLRDVVPSVAGPTFIAK